MLKYKKFCTTVERNQAEARASSFLCSSSEWHWQHRSELWWLKHMETSSLIISQTINLFYGGKIKVCRILYPQQIMHHTSCAYKRLVWYFSGTATCGTSRLKKACTIQPAQHHCNIWKRSKNISKCFQELLCNRWQQRVNWTTMQSKHWFILLFSLLKNWTTTAVKYYLSNRKV